LARGKWAGPSSPPSTVDLVNTLDNQEINGLLFADRWDSRTMNLDALAKRMYPRLPPGRRRYQLQMLLVAISFGLLLGGLMVALIFWMSRVRK
jgi:hypothetical protein